MKLRTQAASTLKTKLSSTLKSWLPLLQSGIGELEETLENISKDNPYFDIRSNIATDFSSQKRKKEIPKGHRGFDGDILENFCIAKDSLEETLFDQIVPPLFPTKKSQDIARSIIENLDEDGYFCGDINKISKELSCSTDEVTKIRKRFAYLEPPGIAASNLIESFYFQLDNLDIDGDVYELCCEILEDLERHGKYRGKPLYKDAMKVISSFKNPPALDYFEQENIVIPDIFVSQDDGNIQVHINDKYYPSIEINIKEKKSIKDDFIKSKIKEARDLVDALEMRKATLYKIGLMIVEYQYDFFQGGEIKPMKLKDLAEEFGHAQSTISRAISNKYLECNRGIFQLKSFFATAIDEETSNTAIKEFVADLVKNEDKQKPLSDNKILELIEERFSIKIVRRTITKYRTQLNIASSSERKKLYKISL